MFADLHPYKTTRPTGLPWCSVIPSHWAVHRAKTLMRAIDIRSDTGDEELLTVSSSRGVVPRSTATVSMFQAESYVGHKLCWPGDLVINSLWAWGRGLGVARHHGIVSTAYGVYRARPTMSLNCDYLHQLVRSDPFQWELQVRSQGVWKSRLQLTDGRWLDAPLLSPPADEQAAIVRYVAHANARIASAISSKRRLIELLREQKRAVIAEAMGSTSDGSRELRHVLRSLIDCEHKTAPFDVSGRHWVLRTSAVKSGAIDWNGAYTTDSDSYGKWTARAVPEPGDIVFTREAPVGEAAVIPGGRSVCLGQRTVLMKLRREVMDPEYLVFQIYGGLPRERISIAVQGSTVSHFNMDDIGWMRVAVPTLDSQRKTVARVQLRNRQADEAIERAAVGIARLDEFRKRLVADAVTGQIDVRGIAAKLPEVRLEVLGRDSDVQAEADGADLGDVIAGAEE